MISQSGTDVAPAQRRVSLKGGLRKLPLQERSRATIQRILETATELVEEVGFEAVVGSPTLLLERSGVSRGSFYAFFESPERVLDHLAYEHVVGSISGVADALAARERHHWTEIVDILVEYYVDEHRTPLVRELWVRQNLTRRVRDLDQGAISALAETLLDEFRKHAPQFAALSALNCAVAVHTLERICQFAFTEQASGDETILGEARAMLMTYFARFA